MTTTLSHEAIIYQLESIKDHCMGMVEPDEPDSIWAEDVQALDAAIRELRMGGHTPTTPGLHFKPRKERKQASEWKPVNPDEELSYRAVASLTLFYASTISGAVAAVCAIVALLVAAPITAATFFCLSLGWWVIALAARGGIPDGKSA